MCALSGRFAEAFYYHPLWPVFVIASVLFILWFFDIIRVKKTVREAAPAVLIMLLLICFVIRHIDHSPVVAIHLKESFLYRLFSNP